MGKHIDAFRARMEEVHDLSVAAAVLGWDQQVFMPPGGAQARNAPATMPLATGSIYQ